MPSITGEYFDKDTGLQLEDNEIHLWLTDLQAVDESLISHYRALMSAQELERNRRYRIESAKFADCVTRAMARTTLSRYAEVEPAAWQFRKTAHGKPEIDAPLPGPPLRFNLSHSKRYVVCAVGLKYDLGVDVECTERDNDVLAIADRYFSQRELQDLFALPASHRERRFFDYWTLKEAFMKASGEGISLGLGNFSFGFSGAGDIAISFGEKIDDDPLQWQFCLYDLMPAHRLALAVRGERPGTPRLRLFETIPLGESTPLPPSGNERVTKLSVADC